MKPPIPTLCGQLLPTQTLGLPEKVQAAFKALKQFKSSLHILWFGNYTGGGRLKEETKVTDSAYQPFRLQNQYADRETGLHYRGKNKRALITSAPDMDM